MARNLIETARGHLDMTDQTTSQYDVFVSYRWVEPDQEWVRQQLVPALEKAGLNVLLDLDDFVPGRDLILEMERAALSSKKSICVISPDYFDGNRMVQFENLMFRRSDPSGTESRLIPLILRPTTLPERLRGLIAVDWTNPKNHRREWIKLLRALNAKLINTPAPRNTGGAADILQEAYHDKRVERIRNQLNQLHTQTHDPATFLQSKVFPILRGLFVARNTFIEPIGDCREENWGERFIAALETRQLIETYRPFIIAHARLGDEELVRSYDQLNLHSYLQEMTGLFHPRPGISKITEQLGRGDFNAATQELQGAEIRPKERIDPEVSEACDEKQSAIRKIWEQWPVI